MGGNLLDFELAKGSRRGRRCSIEVQVSFDLEQLECLCGQLWELNGERAYQNG